MIPCSYGGIMAETPNYTRVKVHDFHGRLRGYGTLLGYVNLGDEPKLEYGPFEHSVPCEPPIVSEEDILKFLAKEIAGEYPDEDALEEIFKALEKELEKELDHQPKIKMDDGTIVYGYQCIWAPLTGPETLN
jgi:hypothetical protein